MIDNAYSYKGEAPKSYYDIQGNVKKTTPLIKITPHVYFDPRVKVFFNSTTDNFVQASIDTWYPRELLHRINPISKMGVEFLRKLSKKPMPRITLKGPSYPKNGRTYQLQSPSNWEHIQNLLLANGAEERLAKIAKKEILDENAYAQYLKQTGKTHSKESLSDFLRQHRSVGYSKFQPGVISREFFDSPEYAGVWDNYNRFEEGLNRMMEYSPATRAHERVHFHYLPTEGIPPDAIDWEAIDPDTFRYLFMNGNGTESSARLSQLKNAAGLTADEEVTPELFEFFRNNYSKYFGKDYNPYKMPYDNVPEYVQNLPEFKKLPYSTMDEVGAQNIGMGNNIEDWFKAIPPNRVKTFLKWANKHAPAATGAIAVGAAALQKNNEQPSNEQ